jgi:hypothetical protein
MRDFMRTGLRAFHAFCVYLVALRVPVLVALTAFAALLTQQVADVLLAMALEPQWGGFVAAALGAVLFGVLLWYASRALTDLRWLGPISERGQEKQSRSAFWFEWWLPRALGAAPSLLLGLSFAITLAGVGAGSVMAVILLLLAGLLLFLLYERTRLPQQFPGLVRMPWIGSAVEAIAQKSQRPGSLFSPRVELLLMGLAWGCLALISVPIAAAAYGPFGGGILHLYALLLGGALLLGIWHWRDRSKRPRSYWISFAVLLLLAALLPPLLTATDALPALGVPRLLGPIALLFGGLSIVLVFASTIHYFGAQTQIPLLGIGLVLALGINLARINDNHALRVLPEAPSQPLLSLAERFDDWLDQPERRQAIAARAPGSPYPVYLVAAQGGGIYAAYHGAKSMAVLEQEIPGFHRHVFAISGVSGGSVGATVFAHTLEPSGENQAIVERVDEVFNHDHLSPVLAAMLFGDAIQRAYPVPVAGWDRALGLELSFEIANGLDLPFHASQSEPWWTQASSPFLVLNTTAVRDGRRLLISPFRFASDARFHEPRASVADNRPGTDLRFSTAAGLSARFPVITPYGFFAGSAASRQNRYVDGGYYDNSGALTAREIAEQLRARLIERGDAGRVRVLPIALANRTAFTAAIDTSAGDSAASGNQLLPSSVAALFASREARVSQTLGDFGVGCGAAASQTEDRPLCITLETRYSLNDDQQRIRTIPLGWSLSCQARAFISAQLQVVGERDEATRLACLDRQRPTLKLRPVPPAGRDEERIPNFTEIVDTIARQINGIPAASK